LHYYQEKSYLEIALELGISYKNVRKRMSQARAILKEKLSEFVGEEDGVPPEPRKRGKSKKRSLRAPAVRKSLASPSGELEEVLPVGSGEPVGAALYALQGEPASEEPSAEGELGIVAGSERMAGLSVAPACFEVLEEEPLGIVAGSERMAGLSVVPVLPAPGETCLDLELGIAAGGEPLLGWTILAAPPPHPLAGCGTGGRQFHSPEMGTGGRTGGTPVLRRDMGTGGRTALTAVLRREMGTGGRTALTAVHSPDVGASVSDGQLGQKEPDAGVREMGWLFGLCWRVWADSGGCWLSSI
jgi:RNA polymerase sigma-70 factor (ECF subfamily)